ncbi:anti-sigma factor [Aquincola sp. S2]|uniref:Anti-sigma factor n=1 Tax=Pseudaquabacterium terrae TaxID=2732868 RepID=A0ABX2EL45_9BURK|nr:anti-sigma factor [Aquabacterium terrae]NRF69249.1 anti-sigma factor [Aquabacterium terrae]
MTNERPFHPDDEQLSAWLDGELDAATHAAVETWLHEHPDDAARVRLWAADRSALRARFGPLADEPVPAGLQRLVQASGRRGGLMLRAALVAGLLVGGALLGAGTTWLLKPSMTTLTAVEAPSPATASWTQRAAIAHAVYAPELRHPVEVDVTQGDAAAQRAQEQHLARWLSKRLQMPVKLFDLRAQGFELVGGRLLPDVAGPSAQLMYQNAAGERVTVYLRRPEPGTHTAFRFQREGELDMFFWAEEGFGCALVGKLPRERLLALGQAAYLQIEAELPAPRPRPGT